MKSSILTFSQTGNTLKVGRFIAKGLEGNGIETGHTQFLGRKKWKPEDADLIGIGSPVFENRPAEVVPEFLINSGFNFRGKKAFVFITSGGSPAKSLWHLAQAVMQTGAKVIGGIQLRGTCTYPTLFGIYPGRPNESELLSAEKFGHSIARHILQGDAIPERFQINPNRGGRFYNTVGPFLNSLKKKTTPLPENDPETCTLCGNCVRECPTNSIRIKNKRVRFNPSCIVCYRCWHVCPENSILLRVSPGNGLPERLVYAEKMERFFGNVTPDENVGSNLYKDVLARRIKLKYNRKHPTSEYEYRPGAGAKSKPASHL